MPYKRKAAEMAGRYAAKRAANAFRVASKGGTAKGPRRKNAGLRTRFAKAVKKVIFSTAESCYKSISKDGWTCNHDSLATCLIWNPSNTGLWPAQGNGDGERRGDEIYATGIMMRMVVQIPHDRRNTKFRMWYVPHNSSQGNPATKSELFHNVSNNVMVDPVQTDRWKGIRYLGQFRPTAVDQTTGAQDKTIFIKRWIPIKRKVTFTTDATSVPASGVTDNGYIIIAAYDSITSLTTDTLITQSETCFTLYYKDP